MEYLFSAWKKLEYSLKTRPLFLFFDYDGTLVPIVSSPEMAILGQETKGLLETIAAINTCKMAVISGRSLEDIEKKIGIKGIVYVGNHGLEIQGPKLHHTISTGRKYSEVLRQVKAELETVIAVFPGAFVEDKGLSLSVHFRRVDPQRIIDLRGRIRTVLIPYSVKEQIKVKTGKMVLEIRPPLLWDKGKIVLWLIARWRTLDKFKRALTIYLGDDTTDEDAFRVLQDKGLTISVGKNNASAAEYYFNSQKEVNIFLNKIIALKQG